MTAIERLDELITKSDMDSTDDRKKRYAAQTNLISFITKIPNGNVLKLKCNERGMLIIKKSHNEVGIMNISANTKARRIIDEEGGLSSPQTISAFVSGFVNPVGMNIFIENKEVEISLHPIPRGDLQETKTYDQILKLK